MQISYFATGIFNRLFLLIYTDFHTAVSSYLPSSVFLGSLALVTFDVTYLLLYRKRKKDYRIFLGKNQLILYISFLYLAFVIYLTILSRPSGSRTGVDLMPFATISPQIAGNIYAAENILLFLPFGMLGCLLPFFPRNPSRCMAGAFIASILIELVQYITKRGYLQTDDVILNVLGCYVGYVIGKQLARLIRGVV